MSLYITSSLIRSGEYFHIKRRPKNGGGKDVFALLPTGLRKSFGKYHFVPQ